MAIHVNARAALAQDTARPELPAITDKAKEQCARSKDCLDGIDFSDDKMLQGRTLSYSDTQRYRVGPNYLQLPVNAPATAATTNQRDGQMAHIVDGGGENPHVNFEPSNMGGLYEAAAAGPDYHQYVEGHLGRYQTTKTADDYRQAGERYPTFEDWERDDLIDNLATDLKQCPEQIQRRMVWHFWHCDPDYGTRVAQAAGIDLEKAKALRPLGGRPAPGHDRPGPTYTDGGLEEEAPQAAAATRPRKSGGSGRDMRHR